MSIFDLFKKNNDTSNPDISFDSIIKSWEEDFLGGGKHNEDFSHPLESDLDFANPNINLSNDNNLVLSALFDKNLLLNKKSFSCINKDVVELFNNRLGDFKLRQKISWCIPRHNDLISKPFLRIVLKKNLTQKDTKNLLYLFADCSFTIEIGGSRVFNLPKFLLVFLISEKLSNPVQIFDVKKYLEENSMEEIKKKVMKFTDETFWANMKYYVKNKTDIYIDIPILLDFFSYNFPNSLISTPYNETQYNLHIPDNKINILSNYIEDIVVMFEEVGYAEYKFRRNLASNPYEFLKMDCVMEYFHCWNSNILEIKKDFYRSKFIFVVIRPHYETNDLEVDLVMDADVDCSQLPQITHVELVETKYDCDTQSSLIELNNIWVGQYDNLIIYGIAADGVSNMKNWIKVSSECVGSIEKIFQNANTNNSSNDNSSNLIKLNNFNANNYDQIYKIVNLSNIKIYFSESTIQTDIEIFVINQNLQRFRDGMTGNAYAD